MYPQSTETFVNSKLSAGNSPGSLGIVADPPLTTKISDLLDEAMSRLHAAQGDLNTVSFRLFSDQNDDSAKTAPQATPQDFSTAMSVRLHYLIGLAGDIAVSAGRLNVRL